ncbi:MAG: TIR domain-containing protein [Anaerolineae bacterium]|nr:TIR domain-containing protein [Anaerolineae bacterium]
MAQIKLFISYARADDEPFVESLYEDLTCQDYNVWWDRKAMESRGKTFLQEIRDAITNANRFILVVGPGAAESSYVRAEWEHALSICQVIIPVLRLGEYDLVPGPLKHNHCIDMRGSRPYTKAREELIRILETEDVGRGRMFSVPELPPHFIERSKDLEAIRSKLLADIRSPTVVTGITRRAGLQGMGGIGKTSLAIALARDCEVRRAFPDGIFWLTIGQNPQVLSLQSQLGEMLGDNPRSFTNPDDGKRRLNTLLIDKSCLLILDDIWETEHVKAFDALGERCRMLITTRNIAPLRSMGVSEHRLETLEPQQALQLLAEWADLPVGGLPPEATEIAEECGNLPLGLAMIGAMVRGKPANRWGAVLKRLRDADLEKIRQDFPGYPYPDLMRAVQVSVDALDAVLQRRYFDFAVFRDDVDIPETVLETFWALDGLDALDTEEIIDELVDRSLLRRDASNRLRLHDLQVDYVRKQAGDLRALHQRLLRAYNPDDAPWHSIAHDGYLYYFLLYHLHEAGRAEAIHPLLTAGREWLHASSAACKGDGAYMADLEFALQDAALETPDGLLRLIELNAARQVVYARVSRYTDLDLQILTRLGRAEEAFSHARLRPELSKKFDGLVAIYEVLTEKGAPQPALLDEIIALAHDIQRQYRESWKLNTAVKLLLGVPDVPRAEQIAASIESASSRAYALSQIAAALAGAGQTARAANCFERAEEVTASIADASERAYALREIAAALAAAGETAWAAECFERAEGVTASIADASSRAYALRDIGTALAAAGETARAAECFERAEGVTASIEDASSRAYALSQIAAALAGAGEYERAEGVTASIESASRRAYALSQIAAALAGAGETARAAECFERAEGVTTSIEDAYSRAYALHNIAVEHGKRGHIRQAVRLQGLQDFDDYVRFLAAIREGFPSVESWVDAVRRTCRIFAWEQASFSEIARILGDEAG